MITRNTMKYHFVVVDMFLEHAWDTVWMMNRGDAGVRKIVLLPMIEKRVLNLQLVACKSMKQVFSLGITCGDSIRPEYLHVFFASARAYPCVDVATDDDHCIRVDGVQHRIKYRIEFIVALAFTWEVCRDESLL